MPMKPAHIALAGGKGFRQRLWDRIRQIDGDFRLVDIVQGSESNATARNYLVGLERGGYLELVEENPRTNRLCAHKRWRLVRDIGAEAPRVRQDGSPVVMGLAQEQMWRTLRTLKGDTNARELAAYASTEAVSVSLAAAVSYLHHLHLANYLKCTVDGKASAGRRGMQVRYRLISNTGPRPPMVQRTDALYDPNLDAVVWVKPVNEEAAFYGR